MLKMVISFVLGVILSSTIYEILYSMGEQGMFSLAKQITSPLLDEILSLKDALLG